MRLFALLFVFLSGTASAAPASIEARYDVLISGMKVGQMDETYTRKGDHYALSSTTTPQGILAALKPGKIISTSAGLIDSKGLRPETFDHVRENDANKNGHAEFDWSAKKITLTHDGQKTVLPLPEGTQDRLSAMYQFMFLDLGKLSSLDFPMTDGKKLDSYHYAVGPLQNLDTGAGPCEGVYLDNQAKTGESRTEIWVSTRYKLPCKMIITDAHGEQVTQLLSSLRISP